MRGDPFGSHRVLRPAGVLPQAAEQLDNDFSRSFDTELLLDVETLNIDAASFRQMEEASGGDAEGVAECVRATVAKRGKQHNPVTGSGGMLLGRVARAGSELPDHLRLAAGTRVATLVSLTLTPLRLDSLAEVRAASAQVDVSGQAVIFASGCVAALPDDLSERLALAAMDVCGAPAQVARAANHGDSVLILGAGGKSGILCAAEARRRVTGTGRVVGLEAHPQAADELTALGLCDEVITADATDALAVRSAAVAANHDREFDVVISCVNVDGAEMGAVLSARARGTVVFFAMSTSFTRAALGAEGASRDVEMRIGNGYAEGHAAHTLDLLRASPDVRQLFEARYGR